VPADEADAANLRATYAASPLLRLPVPKAPDDLFCGESARLHPAPGSQALMWA